MCTYKLPRLFHQLRPRIVLARTLWLLGCPDQAIRSARRAIDEPAAVEPVLPAVVAFASRYVSLASVATAVMAPFYQLLIWDTGPVTSAIVIMSLLLVWRHAGNIRKLIAGTENRLGARPVVTHPSPRNGAGQ